MAMPRWLQRLFARGDGSSDDPLGAILHRRPEVSALPAIGLQEYRKLVAAIPPPTIRQVEDFATFVSGAKSWYKHLPPVPPGVPCTFYVDPWAGLDRVLLPDGRVDYARRASDAQQFHYAWLPTDEHRSRYGHLAFACAAGKEFFLPVSSQREDGSVIKGVLDNNPSRAALHVPGKAEYRLPPELHEAGTTDLTGVIHPLTPRPWIWLRYLARHADSARWPEETGGRETLRKIVKRCLAIREQAKQGDPGQGNRGMDQVDEELAALLAPERRRQQEAMILAMNRMVALLYGSEPPAR